MSLALYESSPALASFGGTSGGDILSIPVGARAIGMGEAFTAVADDLSSLYWNPSGLALLSQPQASFMYSQLYEDLQYHKVAVGMPLENGGLGASLSYLSYGDIQATDTAGDPVGSVDAHTGVATLGGGFLGQLWSAGFNLKGIQGTLADEKATGFATDLGAMLVYPKEVLDGTLRGAFTYRNLGSGLKYINQKDDFPSEWRVGLAALQMIRQKVNLSMDYGQQRDRPGSFYTGAEFWAIPSVALRAGYAGNHTEGSGVRAGLGLKVKDFSFDYAYSAFGDLGMTHRYELTVRFGTIRPSLTPEMRRMQHQAKVAMAKGRYGEATMLFDSLIVMAPEYKPYRRYLKVAMAGYERQENLAEKQGNVSTLTFLGARKSNQDSMESQDLEMLLRMSDDDANAKAPNLKRQVEER
jgi:hypothetical protein